MFVQLQVLQPQSPAVRKLDKANLRILPPFSNVIIARTPINISYGAKIFLSLFIS